MTTVNPGLVAVTDIDTAGAIVWWRLSGAMDLERLREAWVAGGLEEALLPELPSDSRALVRAVTALSGDRVLARPLAKTKGWALVQETATTDTLDYGTVLKASLDADRGLVVDGSPQAVQAVRAQFEAARATLTLRDASTWLSQLIRTTEATPLRDTGGVYFVPRSHVETYRRYAAAIRTATAHTLYEVPALRSEEAVEAILVAVTTEVSTALAGMETEMDTAELGERALRTRQQKCERLRSKVVLYEELLGKSMGELTQGLEGLNASITAAILAASAESA